MKLRKDRLFAILGIIGILTVLIGFVTYSFTPEEVLTIKNITPVYNKENTIEVTENSVVFNDKNQKVEYKVLIENTVNYDVKITDIVLTTPTEDFLKYEIKNLSKNNIIKAKSSKEIVVFLETIEVEGWGRNFEDELVATINYERVAGDTVVPNDKTDENNILVPPNENQNTNQDVEINTEEEFIPEDNTNNIDSEELPDPEELPESGDNINDESKEKENNRIYVLIVFCSILVYIIVVVVLLTIYRKTKLGKLLVLLISLLPTISLVKAEELMSLSFKIIAAYESQNIMKESGWVASDEEGIVSMGVDYWDMSKSSFIKEIYIENQKREITNYVEKYDVSQIGNEKVVAYLVERDKNEICIDVDGNEGPCYDLHLQADGIIYPNENASFYFGMMPSLGNINNLKGMDTSNVTNMRGFFFAAGATNPELILNIADLDTSNVTNMSYMFSSTGISNTSLTLDLSNFDTSNVINMNSMFNGFCEGCQSFIVDLNYLDTSKVEDMSYMFDGMGISSQNYDITMTITNPNLKKYDFVFSGIAQADNTRFIINYTNETSDIVDEMIKTRGDTSHVYKGKNTDAEHKIEIVSGTGTNIGDEIKIANEHFYVISTHGNYTTLISKYNLEVGNECEVDLSHDNVSCVEIPNPSGIQNPKAKGALIDEKFENTIEDYGAITFSSDNYWKINYGSNYPRYVYDEQSDIQPHLSNYAIYLSNTGLTVLDARLISIEELIEFGCDVSSESCHASPYPWLYSTTYWTGSAANSSALYTIYNVGYVIAATYSVDHGGGVRPVITIPTSEITK